MAGIGVSRSHRGNRFYNPPAMRRHQKLLLQQQLHRSEISAAAPPPRPPTESSDVAEVERAADFDCLVTALPKPESVCACSSPKRLKSESNLDSLIESVTPFIPARYCHEVNGRGWKKLEAGLRPFYYLKDLWESLKEWSAYGAEVPLVLKETDSVKQYYVPYLSGIQLYIDQSKHILKTRSPGKKSDTESSRGTNSTSSSDYEADWRKQSLTDGSQNAVNSNSQKLKSLSLIDEPSVSSSGDDSEVSNSSGLLLFEYLEHEQPYSRKPLTDKIATLESHFPELGSYRSCDLLPSSWISIAWYPIYRIPMGSTLKDLDASFLTIHPLSTHSKNGQPQNCGSSCVGKVDGDVSGSSKVSLPVIGIASYKYKGSMLSPSGPQEHKQENLLLEAANSWLQGLSVFLPDFHFFRSHYFSRR